MMQVHIEKVLDLKRQLREINSVDLKEIVWLKEGKAVECLQVDIDDWRFTGLNNTDFVEFYLEEYE
jgi:hypothetical protein